jgi:hypothetical protein
MVGGACRPGSVFMGSFHAATLPIGHFQTNCGSGAPRAALQIQDLVSLTGGLVDVKHLPSCFRLPRYLLH